MHTRLIVKIVWAVRIAVSVKVYVLVGAVTVVIVIFAGAVVDMPAARIRPASVSRNRRWKEKNNAAYKQSATDKKTK